MKKILALVAGIVALTMVSCDKNTPEEVAKEFFTHYAKYEFDQIQDCVWEADRAYYQLVQSMVPEEDKANAANLKLDIQNVKCEIVDDTLASCTCEISLEDKLTSEKEKMVQVIDLKKVGKKWYVDPGKENGYDYMDEPEEEIPSELEEEDMMPMEDENIVETEE